MFRYKQHKTDFEVVPSERPLALPCGVIGCNCPAYQYVPKVGSNPVRCRCKHLPQDHSFAAGHLCNKCESEITPVQIQSILPIYAVNIKGTFMFLFPIIIFSGSSCSGFQSPYTCGCGQPSSAHQTLVS